MDERYKNFFYIAEELIGIIIFFENLPYWYLLTIKYIEGKLVIVVFFMQGKKDTKKLFWKEVS